MNNVQALDDELDSPRPLQSQKILNAAGHKTAIVGKWRFGNNYSSNPQGSGYWNILPGQGDCDNLTFFKFGKELRHSGLVTVIDTKCLRGPWPRLPAS